MSAYNSNTNVKVTRRRPFADKANLMHRKDTVKLRHQSEVDRLTTKDVKLQLQSKVQLQCVKANCVVKHKATGATENIAPPQEIGDCGRANVVVSSNPEQVPDRVGKKTGPTLKNKQKTVDLKLSKKCTVQIQLSKELEQALTLNKKAGQISKAVRFEKNRNSTDKLIQVLRKRRTRNYAESSPTESPEVQENKEASFKEHVPVYLQNNGETQSKTQKDPFEFVVDSPRRRCRGKRFKEPWSPISSRKNWGKQKKLEDWSDSDSSIYNKETHDKEMHDILKRVRLKDAKASKLERVKNIVQQVVKSQIKNAARPNNERLQKNVKGVGSNITVKAGPLESKNKDTLNSLKHEIRLVSRRISDASVRKNAANFRTDIDEGDMFFGFEEDDDDADGDISQVFPMPATPGFSSNMKQISEASGPDRFTLLTSTPLPPAQRLTQPESKTNNSRPRIHIIANVLVTPPRASRHGSPKAVPSTSGVPQEISFVKAPEDDFFGFDDDLNDVIVHSPQTRRRIPQSPWRGDNLNVTRNPHWLAVKDTSLPCYNQEMILEPKLLERPLAAKTPMRVEEPANLAVQSSILDFISSSRSSPVKQPHNSSLFDCNEFSPIKDKNGDPPRNVATRRPNRGKRNILGPSNRNVPPSGANEVLNVENCFGFDSLDDGEAGKENVRVTRNRARVVYKKREEARPMRVHMKQLKKVREEAAEELLERANLEDVNEELPPPATKDSSSETLPEEDAVHVGLFEDLEEVQPIHRSYEPKRRKRVRFPSVDSIEEEEKPRRKRKDIRTPAEEAEYDKWAAAFNAMCEEVEQHSLETDKTS